MGLISFVLGSFDAGFLLVKSIQTALTLASSEERREATIAPGVFAFCGPHFAYFRSEQARRPWIVSMWSKRPRTSDGDEHEPPWLQCLKPNSAQIETSIQPAPRACDRQISAS